MKGHDAMQHDDCRACGTWWGGDANDTPREPPPDLCNRCERVVAIGSYHLPDGRGGCQVMVRRR